MHRLRAVEPNRIRIIDCYDESLIRFSDIGGDEPRVEPAGEINTRGVVLSLCDVMTAGEEVEGYCVTRCGGGCIWGIYEVRPDLDVVVSCHGGGGEEPEAE